MVSSSSLHHVGLLVSAEYVRRYNNYLNNAAEQFLQRGVRLDLIEVATQGKAEEPFKSFALDKQVLSELDLSRVTAAYASEDLQFSWATMKAFLAAVKDAPNIRWLQISWVGLDFPFFDDLKPKPGLVISNAAGTNAKPIATSVLAAVLAFNRSLDRWVRGTMRGSWQNRELLPRRYDLAGQKMVVFGFGAIGQEVGRMCKALGMHVVGIRRNAARPCDGQVCDLEVTPDSLLTELSTADFVAVTSPLTEETRGLFDARAFASMKTGAFFINVGRGPVVDETALVTALQEHKLAGAYLDVFVEEPLPNHSPLWKLDNVILSPHDSASCVDNAERVQQIFTQNLALFGSQKALQNVVHRPSQL